MRLYLAALASGDDYFDDPRRLRVTSRAAVSGGRAWVIADPTVGVACILPRRLGCAAPDWRHADAELPSSPPAGRQCVRPGTMT
jgi:hypothetical protein